jgi:hypothetical protein
VTQPVQHMSAHVHMLGMSAEATSVRVCSVDQTTILHSAYEATRCVPVHFGGIDT